MDYGTTLKVTNGDLALSSLNGLQMVTGIDKARQDLAIIFQTVKGSFPFDVVFGVNYHKLIELQNLNAIEWAVLDAIGKYPHIRQVLNISVTRAGERKALIAAQLLLDTGEELTFEAML